MWFPTAWPSRTSRWKSSGCRAIMAAVEKNVAGALFSDDRSGSSGVRLGSGPSSKVWCEWFGCAAAEVAPFLWRAKRLGADLDYLHCGKRCPVLKGGDGSWPKTCPRSRRTDGTRTQRPLPHPRHAQTRVSALRHGWAEQLAKVLQYRTSVEELWRRRRQDQASERQQNRRAGRWGTVASVTKRGRERRTGGPWPEAQPNPRRSQRQRSPPDQAQVNRPASPLLKRRPHDKSVANSAARA